MAMPSCVQRYWSCGTGRAAISWASSCCPPPASPCPSVRHHGLEVVAFGDRATADTPLVCVVQRCTTTPSHGLCRSGSFCLPTSPCCRNRGTGCMDPISSAFPLRSTDSAYGTSLLPPLYTRRCWYEKGYWMWVLFAFIILSILYCFVVYIMALRKLHQLHSYESGACLAAVSWTGADLGLSRLR